MQSNILTTSI